MARNEEISVYGIPSINMPRYNHGYTVRRKTTGNVGDIIPIYTNLLVQAGDTISMNMRSFFKLTTSLYPSMDNLTADIFCFAEDWQNVWDHTKEFWGEDEATPFDVLPEYTVPEIIVAPTDAVEHDDIIHHLAMPQMKAGYGAIENEVRNLDVSMDKLCYNTYIDIYDRFFRDQNYIPKIGFSKGDEALNYSEMTTKKLLKAARFHDYFAGTPEAQKGEPEFLPLGESAPVVGTGQALGLTTLSSGSAQLLPKNGGDGTDTITAGTYANGMLPFTSSSINQFANNAAYGVTKDANTSGLMADLTSVVGATVNALRLITASQQIKEELMWYGSRFEEIMTSQWGVSMNPTSFRIPEYLGGKRININMDTVLQTSSTDGQSPQGNSAGYSVTFDEDYLFTKSFTTPQIIMILAVIRQDHTYAQGLANQHQKRRKFDFFWKKFEGLGPQPRKKSEIALCGNENDEDIWNHAPAWREYISEVDRATGLLVPGVDNSLANNTYTDEYTTVPNSGQEWIDEIPNYVDRTLVVNHEVSDQFMMDFVFEIEKTSIIPNFRLPGLDKL